MVLLGRIPAVAKNTLFVNYLNEIRRLPNFSSVRQDKAKFDVFWFHFKCQKDDSRENLNFAQKLKSNICLFSSKT